MSNSDKDSINLILNKGIFSLSGFFFFIMMDLWLLDKTNSYVIFIFNTITTSLVPLLFAIPVGIVYDKFKKHEYW